MPWKKGESGNPLGCRIWRDKPIAVLARSHSRQALATLARIMKDEKAPHSARVQACLALLDRGHGKPIAFSTNDSANFKRAIDMSDDELAAIVAKARLTIVK